MEKSILPASDNYRVAKQRAIFVVHAEKESIKNAWQKRAHSLFPNQNDTIIFAMSDTLNDFLNDLTVRPEHEKHGIIRHGYHLPQLLKELSLLRQVIIEELHLKNILTYEIHQTIDEAVDKFISTVANEFVVEQQEELASALSEAESSNRELDQLASVAAHDLKSPLATVAGFIEVLKEEFGDKLGQEGLSYINTIQSASIRMTNLIDHILDYSRLWTPIQEFHSVDMNSVVETTVKNLGTLFEEFQAKIHYQHLPTVFADRVFLIQLFQNLISNSIKFHSTQTPEIFVTAEDHGDHWQFSVKDNGIGFDPQYQKAIFSLYTKLHGVGKYQGCGIGLATCKRVVELHGGKIWAESAPDHGAEFYFTLPKCC